MPWPHWLLGCRGTLHKSIPDSRWHDVYAHPKKERRSVRELYKCLVCGKRWEHTKREKRNKPTGTRWERFGQDD